MNDLSTLGSVAMSIILTLAIPTLIIGFFGFVVPKLHGELDKPTKA